MAIGNDLFSACFRASGLDPLYETNHVSRRKVNSWIAIYMIGTVEIEIFAVIWAFAQGTTMLRITSDRWLSAMEPIHQGERSGKA